MNQQEGDLCRSIIVDINALYDGVYPTTIKETVDLVLNDEVTVEQNEV